MMICNFPDPYPDEILYSLCARYSDRMQYTNIKSVFVDLFGQKVAAKASFPNCLGYLAAHLPSRQGYTVSNLINNHTLLPFYNPFFSARRIDLMRAMMESNKQGSIVFQTGAGLSKKLLVRYTRLCPLCAEEDKEQFGECYWHRVHQLPYTDVCPHHNIHLLDLDKYLDKTISQNKFLSAETLCNLIPVNKLERRVNSNELLLKVANDAFYLLQNCTNADLLSLEKRYFSFLIDKGFSSYKGRIHITEVENGFCQYYSKDTLVHFNCELAQHTHFSWLSRLLHAKAARTSDPIRHLLFIYFIGHTIKTLLDLPSEKSPFGEGPWPCLNSICKHYREKCIYKCEIKYLYRKPGGIFSCESCGFTYTRRGPDQCEEDIFRSSPVKIYGPVWDIKFKELWENPSVSVADIAHQFKVSTYIVRTQAKRLGLLTAQTSDGVDYLLLQQNQRSVKKTIFPGPELLEKYRSVWLNALEKNQDSKFGQIVHKFSATYGWLRTYDEKWLKAHTPVFKSKGVPPRPQIDWEQRDKQFSAEIRSFALPLQSLDYPVRLSNEFILNNVGQKSTIRYNLHRLPLTTETLEEFVETREEFALRRLRCATENFRKECVIPSRTALIHRARLMEAQRCWPSVKRAIEGALRDLENNIV